jgi:hypothetical protein
MQAVNLYAQEYPLYTEFLMEKFSNRDIPFGSHFKDGDKEEICRGLLNYSNKVEGFDPYTIYCNSFKNCFTIVQIGIMKKFIEKSFIVSHCEENSSINILPLDIRKKILLNSYLIESEDKEVSLTCYETFVSVIYDTIKNNADHKEKVFMQLKPKEETATSNKVRRALVNICYRASKFNRKK